MWSNTQGSTRYRCLFQGGSDPTTCADFFSFQTTWLEIAVFKNKLNSALLLTLRFRPAHLRVKSHLDEHHPWGCLLLSYTKGFCYFINKMLSLSSWIQHSHIWKQICGTQGLYTFYRALAKPRGSDVSPSLCCRKDSCQSLPQLLEGSDLLLYPLVLLKGTSGMIIQGQFRQDFRHNVGGLFLTQIIWKTELYIWITDLVKLWQPWPQLPTQTIHCFLSNQSRKNPSDLRSSTFQTSVTRSSQSL